MSEYQAQDERAEGVELPLAKILAGCIESRGQPVVLLGCLVQAERKDVIGDTWGRWIVQLEYLQTGYCWFWERYNSGWKWHNSEDIELDARHRRLYA